MLRQHLGRRITNPRPGYRFKYFDRHAGNPCNVEFIHVIAVRAKIIQIEIYNLLEQSYVSHVMPLTHPHQNVEFTRYDFSDYMAQRSGGLFFLDSKAPLDHVHR